MKTIQQILATTVMGNAHSDRQLFDDIHEFVMRDNLLSEKVQAITKLDRAMDFSAPEATEADVHDYIKFAMDEIAADDPCPC